MQRQKNSFLLVLTCAMAMLMMAGRCSDDEDEKSPKAKAEATESAIPPTSLDEDKKTANPESGVEKDPLGESTGGLLTERSVGRGRIVVSAMQLSEREFQVFLKLAKGETAGDIAKSLSLSVKTVSTYRTRLMEKMALASNSDLTYYALKNKLID